MPKVLPDNGQNRKLVQDATTSPGPGTYDPTNVAWASRELGQGTNVNQVVSPAPPVDTPIYRTDLIDASMKGPLAGKGQVFVDAATNNGLDPHFLAAVAALETGYGTSNAVSKYNNPGGLMDSSTKDMKGFQKFDSIDDGINAMAANLKKTYLDKGLDTIGAIGAVYAPPGAKNDPKNTNAGWPSSVATLYQKFRGEI